VGTGTRCARPGGSWAGETTPSRGQHREYPQLPGTRR
jgi:hypothetical protein